MLRHGGRAGCLGGSGCFGGIATTTLGGTGGNGGHFGGVGCIGLACGGGGTNRGLNAIGTNAIGTNAEAEEDEEALTTAFGAEAEEPLAALAPVFHGISAPISFKTGSTSLFLHPPPAWIAI